MTIAVKPLEWREPERLTNGCWTADSILGGFSVAFDDGWHACLEEGALWEWEPENDPRSYEGPYAAQAACQAYLDKRVRSALAVTSPSSLADANPKIGDTGTTAEGVEYVVAPAREMTDASMDAGQRYLDERSLRGAFILPGTFNWHEFHRAMTSPEALKGGV